MLTKIVLFNLALLCSLNTQTCYLEDTNTGKQLVSLPFNTLQISNFTEITNMTKQNNNCCTCSAAEGCCPAGCANLSGDAQLGCCLGCGFSGCDVMACMGCNPDYGQYLTDFTNKIKEYKTDLNLKMDMDTNMNIDMNNSTFFENVKTKLNNFYNYFFNFNQTENMNISISLPPRHQNI